MRVLVAGATGAIGRPLVAALDAHGHAVAGLTRYADNADLLSRLGAQPLMADVLDRDATAAAVLDARPDVVVDQLTALPRSYTPESMRATLAATGAVRIIGGDNVYAAAVAAGARRYVAQSGCYYYRPGDGLADEREPWVENGPPLVAATLDALTAVEDRTLRPTGPLAGVVLRYGFFYGPGTWFHPDGDVAAQVRAGRFPVLGTGAGHHRGRGVAADLGRADEGHHRVRSWQGCWARARRLPPGSPVPSHPSVRADRTSATTGADGRRCGRLAVTVTSSRSQAPTA